MKNTLYLVYPKSAESGAIETLPNTEGVELVREDIFIRNHDNTSHLSKVCITSEATLDSILEILKDKVKVDAIKSMKDKSLFRNLLKDIYPSLDYYTINLDEIANLKLTSDKIIKPVKGCFGTAVKRVNEKTDLDKIVQEIKTEINKNSSILSENVLSQSEFIVEDYIEGEEYAVDMFFDAKGCPPIVNIYYHPTPKHIAYLHMVYYTNKNVFEIVYDKAIEFFEKLNKKLQLKNSALHAEFRRSENLIPIEINPMRFGGMGLGNMIYHSIGVNPYQCFIKEKSPDWDSIWKKYPKDNFAFLIAYNGTKVDVTKQQPDLEKLENKFTKILNKTVLDYQNQLAFGIYTLNEDIENINNLLQIDFNDYFKDL